MTGVPVYAQLINLLAAMLLLLAFAMLAQRRVLTLINLFAAQGLALAISTAIVAYATAQSHLYWSAGLTLVLKVCLLPWLLTLRLPHAIGPGREPLSQRLAVWSVALGTTLLWLVALVAGVPHPGRIVQVARAQASSMLGQDADERDGNKPWQ